MNRQTEKVVITVETFQRTTVRVRQKLKIIRCEQCAAMTVMLAPDEAAAVLHTTAREIFRLTETNQIHSIEIAAGLTLVCGNSLAAFNTGDLL